MENEMKTQTQTILDAALALPEKERALLVKRLLKSLPQDGELVNKELMAEVKRRRAEVEAGTAKAIPWSELKEED
jgi:putative addiction module component (TIGR02574 family)